MNKFYVKCVRDLHTTTGVAIQTILRIAIELEEYTEHSSCTTWLTQRLFVAVLHEMKNRWSIHCKTIGKIIKVIFLE